MGDPQESFHSCLLIGFGFLYLCRENEIGRLGGRLVGGEIDPVINGGSFNRPRKTACSEKLPCYPREPRNIFGWRVPWHDENHEIHRRLLCGYNT